MKRKILGICSLFMVFLAFGGLSLAYWHVESDTINILSMSSLKAEIEETYKQGTKVMPGCTVDKVVNVKNTGDLPILVRVKLTKEVGEGEGDEFTADEGSPTDFIELHTNSSSWVYSEEDGYYYYKGILESGETTKEPLMDYFSIPETLSDPSYQGKDCHIDVKMEAIQTDGLSAWGKEYAFLGIERPEEPDDAGSTSVTYLGREDEFDIEVSKTDLFANFKDLSPGCGRTQTVHVTNSSDGKAEIFLRAEEAEQEGDAELVRKLLKECTDITITEGDSVLYSGKVWGNLDGSGSTMKNDVSLGTFKAGETKDLTVTLSLDPEMDNGYQEVIGKVKWVFSVSGDSSQTSGESKKSSSSSSGGSSSGTNEITQSPKTGDFAIYMIAACLLMAGACMLSTAHRKGGKYGN